MAASASKQRAAGQIRLIATSRRALGRAAERLPFSQHVMPVLQQRREKVTQNSAVASLDIDCDRHPRRDIGERIVDLDFGPI